MAACDVLGVAPVTHDIGDDADPSQYATALNLCRTHYTPSQRAMFAARVATATRETRPAMRGGEISPPTLDAASTAFAVDRTMVQNAKRLRREAAPEVVQAVERGDITLHKAAQVATRGATATRQRGTARSDDAPPGPCGGRVDQV
jgi:hypothetical protein